MRRKSITTVLTKAWQFDVGFGPFIRSGGKSVQAERWAHVKTTVGEDFAHSWVSGVSVLSSWRAMGTG